jgi:hypothetical protein
LQLAGSRHWEQEIKRSGRTVFGFLEKSLLVSCAPVKGRRKHHKRRSKQPGAADLQLAGSRHWEQEIKGSGEIVFGFLEKLSWSPVLL